MDNTADVTNKNNIDKLKQPEAFDLNLNVNPLFFAKYINTAYVTTFIKRNLFNLTQKPLFQDKQNRGWILVGGSIVMSVLLISMLWQFIFSFMLSYSLSKVFLWFLEHYDSDSNSNSNKSNVDLSLTNTNADPQDSIEYLICLFFVSGLTPLSYVPYMGIVTNLSCITITLSCLSNKQFKHKLCKTIKNMFVSKDYKPNSQQEGGFHLALQTYCHIIESMNIGTINILKDCRSMYSDLKDVDSFEDGFKRLSRQGVSNLGKIDDLDNLSKDDSTD